MDALSPEQIKALRKRAASRRRQENACKTCVWRSRMPGRPNCMFHRCILERQPGNATITETVNDESP